MFDDIDNIITIGSCLMYTHKKILEDLQKGIAPIAVMCAHGQGTESVYAIYIVK